jgi:hypothetical protein
MLKLIEMMFIILHLNELIDNDEDINYIKMIKKLKVDDG